MTEFLQQPLAFGVVAAVLGLFVGSFLNVVIHRLPRMMEREWQAQAAELRGEAAPSQERFNLATPRSRCPHCGHLITAVENIPVVSYLILRGRCRHCSAPISGRYPVVELLSAALSGYAAWHFGFGLAALGALFFLWTMIALAFIDLDTQLLPDDLTLPLLWGGLLFNLAGTYTDLSSAVIGAMAGYLALWSVYWLFKLLTGKEGMGYGDFKLLAAIGAWLGWQVLPLTILLSSLVGAAVGIALIVLARHGRNVPIPFGPYLAAAGVIALFWGEAITRHYLAIF
ncbi:prepilin peptidase [Pseudothauera lacus]|uniref:Prepilin leader peptidase/N-methyltransferase n=1 Tax=Pseudothauera lacus TaxID=2136175 RepID=A0A2T4IG82_9RHOO|nr:A24 family peptidase [Pseudothauera lacus]PTD96793.1 prepilin peptidase [Pseudothauera lacus]